MSSLLQIRGIRLTSIGIKATLYIGGLMAMNHRRFLEKVWVGAEVLLSGTAAATRELTAASPVACPSAEGEMLAKSPPEAAPVR